MWLGKLVTGHENGEITIFHDLGSFLQNNRGNRKNKAMAPPPSTTLHWHAHAVYSMALSPDANYLYSGADEAVLVIWQLGTGIKNFVPRLGGAITFISSSAKEAKVAITTADNAVRIVNTASMREVWELRAMYIPRVEVTKYDMNNDDKNSRVELVEAEGFFQADIKYRCNIRIEGRSGNVACNGYPGQIQMFDLATQTFKTSHEIVQFQRVMRKEAHTRMCAPSTMHFNFLDTPYGSLMVTVDVRKGEEADPEASLKFWEWDAFRSKYRLSVQVDRPHGSWKVTAAVFSPCAKEITRSTQQDVKAIAPGAQKSSKILTCTCATAAIDGSVKIWLGQSQQAAASEDSKLSGVAAIGMQWTCSFSYKHRDCPTGALAFSFDGSLLAATYQNVVTLWDPVQVFLSRSIVIPSRHNVIFAAFIEPRASAVQGGGTGEAMLVVGSKRCLSVYDLISMKVMWCVEGYFSGFAVAPDESAAIRCYSSSCKNNPKSNGLAWIAAAVKRGPNEKRTNDPPNKIVLYGCYSSEPLSVQPSRPRLTSMTFWSNQKDLTSSLSSGLVAITAHGEMVMVGPVEGLKQHCSDRSLTLSAAPPAKVSVVKVPPLPFSAVVHSYNKSSSANDASSAAAPTSSSNLSQSVIQQQGSIAISKNWLGELFDAKSGSIPPLSSIYSKCTLDLFLTSMILSYIYEIPSI
jgi:WD40 repeat protein